MIRTLVFLFLSALAFFAVFAPAGHIPSDTFYSIETARSLVQHKSWAIPQTIDTPEPVAGKNGQSFSKYGIGYAFDFIPQVALAEWLATTFHQNNRLVERIILSFSNSFFAALFVVLFFLLCIRLGYGVRPVFTTLLLLLCGSILLPSSKMILVETPIAVFLLFSVYIVASKSKNGFGVGLALGLISAVLVLLKVASVIYLPIMAFVILVQWFRRERPLVTLFPFLFLAVLPFPLLFYLNDLRFGAFLNFGYGADQYGFTFPFLKGFLGFFISPAKSMILYSPLILLAIGGLWGFYKRNWAAAFMVFLMFIVTLLFHAKWFAWTGGWCWGPRLIVPALLIMHVPLVDFVATIFSSRIKRALLIILLVPSLAIQALGTLLVYQEIHYLLPDTLSLNAPHIQTAVKMVVHKVSGKPEIYRCSDDSLDARTGGVEPPWKGKIQGENLDLTEMETYRGFNIFWLSAFRMTQKLIFLLAPIALLLISGLLFFLAEPKTKR